MKSAAARSQASRMFQATPSRSNLYVAVGLRFHGSRKDQYVDLSSAIRAPICWSPPRGPPASVSMGYPVLPPSIFPVVPVATRSCSDKAALLYTAHSISLAFLLSCATGDPLAHIVFRALFISEINLFCPVFGPINQLLRSLAIRLYWRTLCGFNF